MAPALGIRILGLDGSVLELNLPSASKVQRLREEIAAAWQIPPTCQRLVHDTEVLENGVTIGSLGGKKSSELTLNLIVILDEVTQVFERCGGLATEVKIMRFLNKLAVEGNADASKTRRACLHHRDCRVRGSALEALGLAGNPGDEQIFSAACGCLEDSAESVRCSALRALWAVTEKGDGRLVPLVLPFLGDPAAKVRHAAVQIISDSFVISGSSPQLVTDSEKLESIVAGLSDLLADEDVFVQNAARRALQKLEETEEPSELTLELLKQEHSSWKMTLETELLQQERSSWKNEGSDRRSSGSGRRGRKPRQTSSANQHRRALSAR